MIGVFSAAVLVAALVVVYMLKRHQIKKEIEKQEDLDFEILECDIENDLVKEPEQLEFDLRSCPFFTDDKK
ncbi:MAG: hypothetical protein WC895_05165 [Candidatus Shapirobacteria bacterium]|jgi:hypothetical protein